MLPEIARRGPEFYPKEQTQDTYCVGRGFFDARLIDGRQTQSVDEALPSLMGKRASQWLGEIARARRSFEVLDIGCGNGQTILDIENRYPHAEAYGITKAKIEPYLANPSRRIIGAIENLDLSPNSYDFVFSAFALAYSREHILKTLSKTYGSLRVGGVAFLQVTSIGEWKSSVKGIEELKAELSERRIPLYFEDEWMQLDSFVKKGIVDVPSIALMKTRSSLPDLSSHIPDGF